MPAGTVATDFSISYGTSVLVTSTHEVYDWGYHYYHPLGPDPDTTVATPIRIAMPTDTATEVMTNPFATSAMHNP